jgi:hypothetical protein
MPKGHISLLLASFLVGGIFAMGGVAEATPTTTTIGPHQPFVGVVNGKSSNATVVVACPGPAGRTGHPVGGTIAVEPPSTVSGTTGYTGSRGHSVVARFVLPVPTATAPPALTFAQYGSQPIPSSMVVPCSGTGVVVFSPQPTSKTARSTSVGVTFENIAVDPPPTARRAATPSRTITVTRADSGQSYRLHPGDGLDVQLSGPSDVIWTEPTSSNQSVLHRTVGSSGTRATGIFVAKLRGKAQVTALGSPNCSANCPQFLIAFQVSVVVVG